MKQNRFKQMKAAQIKEAQTRAAQPKSAQSKSAQSKSAQSKEESIVISNGSDELLHTTPPPAPPILPKTLNTNLGRKGYSVLKSELDEKEQEILKKKLLINPMVGVQSYGATNKTNFPIYRESNQKIYMPRYFGEREFGKAKTLSIPQGDDIQVAFKGELREIQKPVINAYLKIIENNEEGGGLLELPCAAGKCLGKDTKILMYDGSIKKVQDIVTGDLIMGDDSTQRTILSIARGRETMYKVNIYGKEEEEEGYIVNESHILSLKRVEQRKEETVDMPLLEYMKEVEQSRTTCSYRGYRVPILFDAKEIELDPYVLGYIMAHLLENNSGFIHIHDYIILKYIEECVKTYHMDLIDYKGNYSYRIQVGNELANEKYNIFMGDAIPREYICNTREIQLNVLAGIIDAVGFKYSSFYNLEFINPHLAESVAFLARSLGFYCAVNHVMRIYGTNLWQIPVKCHFKKMEIKNSQNNLLNYKIKIQKLEVDDYYGFEIDGNRRFVLGDFTVTHNTVCAIHIITQVKKKALVIVNKEFLLNQWIERIGEFAPTARVGRIQGPIIDIENKDIVIGMLQSLSMKDYPAETFESFGLTIIDEVHHISSEVFSCALFKIVTKYMLGLSATMERKDGTTFVFKEFLGDIVYKGTNEEHHKVCVRAIEYITSDEEFNKVECDFRGNVMYSRMIVKLCDFSPRSDFIVKVIEDLIQENPKNQIMVIGHNRSILKYIYEAIEHKQLAPVGYYVGGMKQEALDESSKKQIVLSSYSMAAEALDIKTLSTMVMVTPKTDIIQCVGRILRVRHSKPIIVDIVDKHPLFQNQWSKRRIYYKKCNYNIRMSDSKKYKDMQQLHDSVWKKIHESKEDMASTEEPTTPFYGKCFIQLEDADADGTF